MKKIILGLFLALTSFVIWMFSITVGEYPELNTCLKASVSGKLICSKIPDYISLSNISPYFLDAVVMSEDDKFYAHDGFDWKELRRSMLANLRKLSFVRGGSTITQQLVKNIYLSRDNKISRKIVEARLANRVEKKHSKKLILEKYVNAIEYGKNIWGIKQASKFYFKKEPASLGVLESLYLVVLLPSPVKYSQTFFKRELSSYQIRRIKTLIRRFKRRGLIDKDYARHLEGEVVNFPWDRVEIQEEPEALFEELEEQEVEPPEDYEMEETDSIEEDGGEDLEEAVEIDAEEGDQEIEPLESAEDQP